MPLDWRKRGGKEAGGQLANLATAVYRLRTHRAVMCGTDACAASARRTSETKPKPAQPRVPLDTAALLKTRFRSRRDINFLIFNCLALALRLLFLFAKAWSQSWKRFCKVW